MKKFNIYQKSSIGVTHIDSYETIDEAEKDLPHWLRILTKYGSDFTIIIIELQDTEEGQVFKTIKEVEPK